MKNFLFILTFLLGTLLFSPQSEEKSNDSALSTQEAVMKEKGSADVQHFLSILSTDLRDSKGLTTRRTVQSVNNTFHVRSLRLLEKVRHDIRLKSTESRGKVLENVSEYQTINLSTLLCRMAQHVFVLRKLII